MGFICNVVGRPAIVLACVGVLGCGSPLSPSRSTSDFAGVGINVSSATAKLVRWANGPSVIMYEMCSGMAPRVSDSMTIQAVEYSVVAPDGSAYTAFKDSNFPAPLHLGFVGCQILYPDP